MISKTMQDAFNEQMKHEFYSSYLYLSMSAYCDRANLPGLARWMRAQAQEENKHGMKIFDHLLDRGGRVELQQLGRPPADFATPREVFEQAHKHEQQVTASINKVYGLAVDERDFASTAFLDWFVREQVEEEKTSGLLAEQFRMVGEDRPGLLMLDRELGQRKSGQDEGTGGSDVSQAPAAFLGLGAIGAPMAARLARAPPAHGVEPHRVRVPRSSLGSTAPGPRATPREAAARRRGGHHLSPDVAGSGGAARRPGRPPRRAPARRAAPRLHLRRSGDFAAHRRPSRRATASPSPTRR